MFKTPILILSYRRPDYLKVLLNRVKSVNPKKIFFFNDGPKNRNDIIKINEIKKLIYTDFNKSNIVARFEKKNLGLRNAVIKGINWFFKNNQKGIILEDDCIPSKSFFSFCEKNLNYHEKNNKVMNIGGLNLLNSLKNYYPNNSKDSYYFNKIPMIWGWATWRNRWTKFDREMKYWKHARLSKKILYEWFCDKHSVRFYKERIDAVYFKKDDSWAFSWLYTIRKNNGLNIIPKKNMIKNIGLNSASHSTPQYLNHYNLKTFEINKIVHPSIIIENNYADKILSKIYLRKTFLQIIFYLIRIIFINKFYNIKKIIKKIN